MKTAPDLFRTVRAPDVAFVRADRLAGAITDTFIQLAPDLAVEVLSPSSGAAFFEGLPRDLDPASGGR